MSDPGSADAKAIIAGHGDFAQGLISAVDAITGRGSLFVPVSARDLSGSQLEDALRGIIERTGIHIVFTDLQAGSCTMAARRVLRDRDDVLFVCGANLPMLLDFALAADTDPAAAARHALERGRAAIMSVGGSQGSGKSGRDGGGGTAR